MKKKTKLEKEFLTHSFISMFLLISFIEIWIYFHIRFYGLLDNYVTQSCLYAIFRWLISHVQLSFQSPSVNVRRQWTDIRGDTVMPVRIYFTRTPKRPRCRGLCNFRVSRNSWVNLTVFQLFTFQFFTW